MKDSEWAMPKLDQSYMRRVPQHKNLWALDPRGCAEMRLLLKHIRARDDAYLAHPGGTTKEAYRRAETALGGWFAWIMADALVNRRG